MDDLAQQTYRDLSRSSIRLADIEPMIAGQGERNTFVGSFKRLLKVLGADLPYWHLMGVCGAAFRLQVHCNSWRMVSTDITSGFDLAGGLFSAFGLVCERHWVCGDPRRMKALRNRIIANLDNGIPTIGLGLTGEPEYGLVIGSSNRSILLAVDYALPNTSHAVNEDVVWCYFIITERREPLPAGARLLRGFELARTLVTSPRAHSFHLGLDAYDYWYSTLVNPEHHKPLSDDWRTRERNEGNYRILVTLIDARESAARFCEEAAAACPRATDACTALAACYRQMVGMMSPLIDRRVVRPAAQINPAQPWTMHDRRKQARLLMEVREIEARTVPLLDAVAALLR
ncbi:hypothetical protein GX586_11385 [bacterium]|nr:hypothetical protein [bacterium]